MTITQGQRNFLLGLGVLAAGYVAYKVSQGEKIETAIKEPVVAVVSATESIKKKLVKGSPEAKEHMRKLLAMRKNVGRKKKEKTDHKGHETKRGLAQDQKLSSNEDHEKAYQKIKSKRK